MSPLARWPGSATTNHLMQHPTQMHCRRFCWDIKMHKISDVNSKLRSLAAMNTLVDWDTCTTSVRLRRLKRSMENRSVDLSCLWAVVLARYHTRRKSLMNLCLKRSCYRSHRRFQRYSPASASVKIVTKRGI